MKSILALSVSLFALSVSVPPANAAKPAAAAPKLSQTDAKWRAERISQVRYDLFFRLDPQGSGSQDFHGFTKISFQLQRADGPIRVDFQEGKPTAVTLNGAALSAKDLKAQYNGAFFSFPAERFKPGANEITVEYDHPYSRTGSGLYRFQDPEDQRIYTYTDFEPYQANNLFPCFDQPDLKAMYTVDVDAPGKWVVISSSTEKQKVALNNGRALWKFSHPLAFSTYLFSLHSGEYQVWETKPAGSIPLRLFARHSLAKYVHAEEWFDYTRQGFEFYQKYFDFAYPFGKYDQVIVPDFNAGAMENIAAVTFSERYVQRGPSTGDEKERRASVILHEMAHMWFGDIVTMKWWDDLWLNESFATFMAALAQYENTKFKQAWHSFFAGSKVWAYTEDQLVTTHPIQAEIPDTDAATTNFDGITYGKGASVMKQVLYYAGANEFRDGVRAYFKQFAYQNAELKDFMAALTKASGKDLGHWTERWLQTAGVNTLEAKYQCKDGKISEFMLVQDTGSGQPVQRPHRTLIGLFRVNSSGKVELANSASVLYTGPQTAVSAFLGKDCPFLVFPNHEDHDYAKVRLDTQTLANAKTHLAKIEDSLVRTMFWQALWDMVRDAQFPAQAYAELVIHSIGMETDVKLAGQVLQRLYGRYESQPSVITYLPRGTEASEKNREALHARLEEFFLAQLKQAKPESDFQKLWFDSYYRVAKTKTGQETVKQLLGGQLTFPGLQIDQDRRWNLVKTLNRVGSSQARELAQAELKRDPSDKGKKALIASEASRPELSVKRKWFSTVSAEKSKEPLANLKEAMWNLFPSDQTGLRAQFASSYFENLLRLEKRSPSEFLGHYAESLMPALCTAQSTQALGKFIHQHPTLNVIALKALKEGHDEDGRCVKVRTLAAEFAKTNETKRP
ncbi:MAG: aminopeptidase N [Bacteriovoracia bacterium]